MFYVKEKINDTTEINIEITDENVFCKCLKCGVEVRVFLEDVLKDNDTDLLGTTVFCDKCSKTIGGNNHGN